MGIKVSETRAPGSYKGRSRNKNQGEIPLSHGNKKEAESDPMWLGVDMADSAAQN